MSVVVFEGSSAGLDDMFFGQYTRPSTSEGDAEPVATSMTTHRVISEALVCSTNRDLNYYLDAVFVLCS